MSRWARVALAVLALGLTVAFGSAALLASDPIAEDFQGNFFLSNPNYPEPEVCAGDWLEVRDQKYVGTITSNIPELNNRKMVLDSFYLGGGGGSGVAFGNVSVFAPGAVKDVLVAKGPLTVATNGYVPPENSASANGWMDLTLYERGQLPTKRRALAHVKMTIFGAEIHAGIGGGGGDKSVVWNGETCP